MKKRLELIAKKPRTRVSAAAVTALLAVLLTGCAFTGAKTPATSANETAGDTTTLTAEEIRYFNTEFFNGSDSESMLHNNIANDSFDTPQGVNLFQMFYNGTGSDDDSPLTEKELSLLGISEAMDVHGVRKVVTVNLPAVYNIYNAAGALTAAVEMGVPADTAAAALGAFKCGFGRMEKFDLGAGGARMNRVASPEFPDTVAAVLAQPGQYYGPHSRYFQSIRPDARHGANQYRPGLLLKQR